MKNRLHKRNNHPLKWITTALVVLFLFPVTTVVYCAEPGEANTETYRYNPEGKPDPFKPFIEIVEEEKKPVKVPQPEEHKDIMLLPPLQRFGTEEFRLTGIVLAGEKKIAMVETPDGKRYILRTGTRIGINNGTVMEIVSNSVVVLEEIKDFEGNIQTERVILTLRKNGGDS
jgi:Tfp pilus assembly protein PilP